MYSVNKIRLLLIKRAVQKQMRERIKEIQKRISDFFYTTMLMSCNIEFSLFKNNQMTIENLNLNFYPGV